MALRFVSYRLPKSFVCQFPRDVFGCGAFVLRFPNVYVPALGERYRYFLLIYWNVGDRFLSLLLARVGGRRRTRCAGRRCRGGRRWYSPSTPMLFFGERVSGVVLLQGPFLVPLRLLRCLPICRGLFLALTCECVYQKDSFGGAGDGLCFLAYLCDCQDSVSSRRPLAVSRYFVSCHRPKTN